MAEGGIWGKPIALGWLKAVLNKLFTSRTQLYLFREDYLCE